MSELICKKTMTRCQTPGMCSPHGGCQPEKGFESEHLDLGKFVDWVWALKTERDQLMAVNFDLNLGKQAADEEIARIKAENEALRKRADRWEEVGRLIVSEMPLRLRPRVAGNAPGHSHEVPGTWDADNGELAGRECAWCKVWATARELSKGSAHE